MKESDLMVALKELEMVVKCEHEWEVIYEEGYREESLCRKCGIRRTVIVSSDLQVERNENRCGD